MGRDVLQGDCQSPLILTFASTLKLFATSLIKSLINLGSLSPVHWFQFTDDATVIIGFENENRILRNHFTRWCTWANMIIRVDACSTFGIKKASASSAQYLPKLMLNHNLVPTVQICKSLRYIGRSFNFSIDTHNYISEILDLVTDLMTQIHGIPCHPKNRLLLYDRFVLSKMSWHFTIANLGKTWVIENILYLVAIYVCPWLELPISATFSILILPKSKYGINFILPSTKFLQCQTDLRIVLKSSPNSDIHSLWAKTSFGCNVQYY